MDDLTIARAIHVAAIVHWIGGVSFVTVVLLPGVRRLAAPEDRARLFEQVEGAFSWQAKISVTLAGLAGFWMTHRIDAWGRFPRSRLLVDACHGGDLACLHTRSVRV